MKKVAVIGASSGQLPLVKKAKEMGLEVHCFAWNKDAICKNYCDFFYPISIYDTDEIVHRAKLLGISGVVTNASEETALAASIVAEGLRLNCTPSNVVKHVQNKQLVREITKNVQGLSIPKIYTYAEFSDIVFPCVVKPVKGSAKRGVTFCNSKSDISEALDYARQYNQDVIAEEYISGNEYSVETLSYHGVHEVIQITKKITSGFPHFVELEHHQPAQLPIELSQRIHLVIKGILESVGISNGASHIEIKVDNDNIYLIEINPRGGGDRISDTLVSLSTDCDYLKCMIEIAIDEFKFNQVNDISYSGILFLNKQNEKLLRYFEMPLEKWMYERHKDSADLRISTSNYDRNGYIIYNSKTPINF